jgi:hypothetical protein
MSALSPEAYAVIEGRHSDPFHISARTSKATCRSNDPQLGRPRDRRSGPSMPSRSRLYVPTSPPG